MAEQIKNTDAQYALDIVREICTKVGPGLPGTPQEQGRAEIIKEHLISQLGAEHVRIEEFTFAPGAALYGPLLSGILMIVAVLLNVSFGHFTGFISWITSITALLISIIVPMLFILEFLYGFEFVDPLYKQKQSWNVIGSLRKPGTKNVKRLLMISGHHDSAPENTWMRLLGFGQLALSIIYFLGFIVMLVVSVMQLTGLIISNTELIHYGTLGWVLIVFPMLPAVIYALFLNRGMKNGGTVPGAADNLSASAVVVAMCRFLVKNPSYIPADTEIRFISFGSEEAGLRGSRRYVKRHLDELKQLDARLLNYEMIVHPEIDILARDINGTVLNSDEMVKSVVTAAERANVPHRVKSGSLGVITDSGIFSRAGFKATALLPTKIPTYYHQRWDTPDKVTIEPLINALKITLEWIRNRGE